MEIGHKECQLLEVLQAAEFFCVRLSSCPTIHPFLAQRLSEHSEGHRWPRGKLIRLSCQILSVPGVAGGTEAIVIKPAEDSDAAQAPLAEWTDLELYARGIVERQAAIPPDLLSLPHGLTPLPLEAPLRFVAEPYVATDKCVLSTTPVPAQMPYSLQA